LGIGAQAGIQLLHDGETAGLNLYARAAGAFDRDTVQIAELFATKPTPCSVTPPRSSS
jgi:hypothetical protein